MKVDLNSASFEKTMQNIINYSFGFIEGAQNGKRVMLDNLGKGTIEALNQYIDAMARGDQTALHHVYEWYQTGSPAGRLFDLQYTVSNAGLSLKSSFRQSTTVAENSTEPFYDKARIMENGIACLLYTSDAADE